MYLSRQVITLLACSAALLAGCVDSDVQSPVEVDDLGNGFEPQAGGGIREPPSGSNGDLPTCLWAATTQAALRTLAAGKLDTGGGLLPSMPQVDPQCREILHTAVKCALSTELSIEDADTGEVYNGWWGVAPNWLKAPLDTAGRRWVTACMIQKLNYNGVKVPILMEGVHPQLNTVAQYEIELPFDESTAFGDMFSSTAPLSKKSPPFEVYVCSDDDLVSTCGTNLGSPWLQYRICDGVGSRCGMTFLGRCSSACAMVGGYWQCTDPDGNLHTETVHVQLEGFGGVCF